MGNDYLVNNEYEDREEGFGFDLRFRISSKTQKSY